MKDRLKMTNDELMQIKSGGRRISLYAEVGKYFSPDGHLDEVAFSRSLGESFERIKAEHGEKAFSEKAGEWLSGHLDYLLDYLEEKGMTEACFHLFQVAVSESSRMGVERVEVSSDHLQKFLSKVSIGSISAPEKKGSPEDKRRRIFEAALRVFGERGFHEATIDEIASLSGVAKGTVYRNFKSKQDLLDQLLIEKSREVVSRFVRIFSREDDVLDQIREAIELYVEFIENNHILYRLIQSEGILQKSGGRAVFYDYFISQFPMIKERIVALNRDGDLKTTGFYTVFYGLMGFIDGVVHRWFRSEMAYPLRDEVPVILEVLFNGFVGEKAGGKRFFVPPEEATA
jgi:AcrR family transcriptional regulator